MYDYSGIMYRIWGVGGILTIGGVVVLIISFLVKSDELQKRNFIAGLIFFVIGLGLAIEYASILKDPEVQVFDGVFIEEYRNSRVAPPLPCTWEYTFGSDDGVPYTFYLDTFSKKGIFNDEFVENAKYRIYYESEHNIIVEVELLSS